MKFIVEVNDSFANRITTLATTRGVPRADIMLRIVMSNLVLAAVGDAVTVEEITDPLVGFNEPTTTPAPGRDAND